MLATVKHCATGGDRGLDEIYDTNREGVSVEQYNKEIDEAVARVESGQFYTQEEVEKMAEDW